MPEFLLPFSLFAFVGSITPGPNNIMLTASGANFGFRRTIPHVLGICIGFPAMVMAIGLGLGQLFEEVPKIHTVLKLLGTAYLLWLAWRIAAARATDPVEPGGRPLSFLQAAAFQWVNPKAWILASGAVSTFTLVGQEMLPQITVMAAIFTLAAVPATTVWTLLGVGIARLLRSPIALRIFNVTMGALLAVSVLWIWLE